MKLQIELQHIHGLQKFQAFILVIGLTEASWPQVGDVYLQGCYSLSNIHFHMYIGGMLLFIH